jgi:hypothetical protein
MNTEDLCLNRLKKDYVITLPKNQSRLNRILAHLRFDFRLANSFPPHPALRTAFFICGVR